MATSKVGVSYHLSMEAVELINAISKKLGISKAGTLEQAIRKMALIEDVEVPARPEADSTSESLAGASN